MTIKLLPALLLATQLHASLIDLGPNRTSHSEDFSFNELIGKTGQQSLDLMFNKSITVSAHGFDIGLGWFSPTPDFVTGTGELLDINGNAITPPTIVGSATGNSNGVTYMFIGLFPFFGTGLTGEQVFYGVHFDLLIPDVEITSGTFGLFAPDYINQDGFRTPGFRIGEKVPDAGNTITLLFVALLGLSFYDKKTTS